MTLPADGLQSAGRKRRRPRFAQIYATAVIRLRWFVIAGWVIIVAVSAAYLPVLGSGDDEVASIIPTDSPALRAEFRSINAFGYPLTSRTAVIQRDPAGLSPYVQAESVLDALAVNQSPPPYPLLGALPVTNTFRLFPASAESDTAVLTYLFMNPFASLDDQQRGAQAYIDTHLSAEDDYTVGVTGSVPARAQQADLVTERLPVLELLTILAIAVLLAVNYRALLPPVMALTASAVAFLVTLRVGGYVEQALGLAIPAELEPLLVALLLGVVTDYTIFYVSAYRNELQIDEDRRLAAHRAVSSFTPIVLAAGITVAAGTAALLAAKSSFFQAIGPAMALSIVVGVLVSVTLIPALLAVFGRGVFFPSKVRRPSPASETPSAVVVIDPPLQHVQQTRFITWLIRPRNAGLVLAACVVGLVLVSLPLRHINLGIGFTQSLPSDNPVKVASNAAAEAFAPGITSPTTILIEGEGITRDRAALDAFQSLISSQPGVAGVVGPADNLTPLEANVVLARTTDAARLLVVFDHDPLGATAIDDLSAMRQEMPRLAAESGLSAATISIAGDTALAEGLVSDTGEDLKRIAIAAIVINFFLLAVFLRALVAPIYLLASSLLALTAAMGLTTFVFQDLAGGEGLTFYVPFAASVLLIALGSDYNIFGVGHVWELARDLPMREAILTAVPESTRAIATAGVTLAVSFAMLVVIPLGPFRELGFAMAVGILLDVVVIRSLMTPCMLTLVGPVSGWPSHRFATRIEPRSPAVEAAIADAAT